MRVVVYFCESSLPSLPVGGSDPKHGAKSATAGKNHDPRCMLQRVVFGERRLRKRSWRLLDPQVRCSSDLLDLSGTL